MWHGFHGMMPLIVSVGRHYLVRVKGKTINNWDTRIGVSVYRVVLSVRSFRGGFDEEHAEVLVDLTVEKYAWVSGNSIGPWSDGDLSPADQAAIRKAISNGP